MSALLSQHVRTLSSLDILIPTLKNPPKDIGKNNNSYVGNPTKRYWLFLLSAYPTLDCMRMWHIDALHRHGIGAAQLPKPRKISGADARVPRWLQYENPLSLRRWSQSAQKPHIDANLIGSQPIHTSLQTMHPVRNFFHTRILAYFQLFRPVLVQICWINMHCILDWQYVCTHGIGLEYMHTYGTQSVCTDLF